ncbi:Iron-sulfur clusters transporter atm1, mitochondrial [Smittium culicis]|uniref:Iron-sulfur clusters transporter ATM1, mitochondrial n=1 Tax=Smittium culicis TaxID=133412 RepID=A0A1R1YSS0_9FUNG|nr:Iron-sulfur clusters transporter atm1, mitochondrial [Smittium culicis]OMJ29895.1 Iron-sulfur clusters transporter atm1, mitochondrial [Smittium culicis]
MGSVLSTASVALLAGYGIARLSASIMQELRTAVFARVQQDAIRRLAREIYRHLLNMDMKFHLSRETGGLVRAVDRGTKTKFRVNMNNADNQAASIATDSLLNVEAVKYFNAENYQIEKYDKALAKYHKSGLKTSISLAYLNAGQNIIFSTSLAAMMYMAANGVINGSMSIGDLVMVNGLIFQLSLPLNFLGTVYREMNQAMIDMDTLFNLEKTKPLIGNDENPLEVKGINGSIDFKNVSFSYEVGRPILNDLSFSLPPGKRVAFVGPSGCGKSTILRLLYRFYDLDKGLITIDGIPINKISLDSLRRSIAIVPQDTVLFNSTIFENIAFGNSEATIDDVIEVSKMARLHALISSLPQGYNTPVGERGLMISGGERQRIALARALLKKSPIILFDEATSALDAHTERSIMNSVTDILDKEQCTAIFIAHRLRTIKNFDLIYVLKKGKLVEVGTHDELLKLKGTYFELWSIQEHGNKKRAENLHTE